ncbi:hypothetical protein WKH57_15135 [Niallia taxi]|uniref:hypothetical protein n=1 Tax=Niallia taxi TaxID=2499688 RepID=UPI00317379DE
MAQKQQAKKKVYVSDIIYTTVGFGIMITFLVLFLYSCAKPTYDSNDFNKDGIVDDTDRQMYENTRQQVEDAVENGLLDEGK